MHKTSAAGNAKPPHHRKSILLGAHDYHFPGTDTAASQRRDIHLMRHQQPSFIRIP